VFQPVFAKIGVSAFRHQMALLTETENPALTARLSVDSVDAAIDQLRSKLFDSVACYNLAETRQKKQV